jgi:hypothetical protein
MELRGHRILEFLAETWKRASTPERIVAGVSAAAIAGTAVAWVYSMAFGA